MSRQKEDLERSIADLQQTIVKLNRVCRLRFKESFDAINEKFEAIFPRLFRGGKARLVLTDENDFLETGVDIIVQPPGKKLQSITLAFRRGEGADRGEPPFRDLFDQAEPILLSRRGRCAAR